MTFHFISIKLYTRGVKATGKESILLSQNLPKYLTASLIKSNLWGLKLTRMDSCVFFRYKTPFLIVCNRGVFLPVTHTHTHAQDSVLFPKAVCCNGSVTPPFISLLHQSSKPRVRRSHGKTGTGLTISTKRHAQNNNGNVKSTRAKFEEDEKKTDLESKDRTESIVIVYLEPGTEKNQFCNNSRLIIRVLIFVSHFRHLWFTVVKSFRILNSGLHVFKKLN